MKCFIDAADSLISCKGSLSVPKSQAGLSLLGQSGGKVVFLALAILFAIYIDSLLESLRASGRGCYWGNHFSGALCYADNLIILAPSPDGLRKMLAHCESYADLLSCMVFILILTPLRLNLSFR